MDPDMHTVLSDTNNLKLMELHFRKLREQSKTVDQMKTAGEILGSVPETSLVWDPIMKERGGFWVKIWCRSRAPIGAKARGITSPHAEELTVRRSTKQE